MKPGATLFLKLVIGLVTLAALSVCFILAPELAREETAAHPERANDKYIFLAVVYTFAVPVFVALYQALKLVGNIEKDQTFTQSSVRILRNIKYCAITVMVFLVSALAFLIAQANGDDVAGVVMVGLILTFISSTIATFMAVVQKLLQNAVDIKLENDSTI